jgi:hypothetical protein
MPARSLADALADSPAGPLIARIARMRRISRALAEAVAPLAPDFDAHDPWAVELREGVLLLNARSAAQAAKLRQGVPGLLLHLHQDGAQVTEIRVKVQPARMSYPERANDHPQVSAGAETGTCGSTEAAVRTALPTAVAGVKELAAVLSSSLPDSPLKQAAGRLQAALRRTESGLIEPRDPKRPPP